MVAMPRDGAIIFSDLSGKTEVLRVTCEKCGRDGRYIVARLIRNRGRDDARQVFYAIMVAMPRDGAIIFSDLIGKLEVLRVTCEKCGRDGSYRLNGLIE